MTPTDLITLRRDYALGSTVRLAERIGCHASTIYRNIRKGRVTPYVRDCIEASTTASAFLRGVRKGRIDYAREHRTSRHR
jgi:hypothetical protein